MRAGGLSVYDPRVRTTLVFLCLGGALAWACGDDGGPVCDCAEAGCYAAACTKAVFVTSTAVPANFGGVAQADKLCQDAAAGAGLAGTFQAWLSDSTTSPFKRAGQSTVPYQLVSGVRIAEDWDQLVASGPAAPIDVDERGQKVADEAMSAVVWTNTGRDGRAESYSMASNFCADWTNNAPTDQAVVGWMTKRMAADDWTFAVVQPCTGSARLYCFQQ